jgi:hypothetical protein
MQAAWVAAPLVLGGLSHVAIIRTDTWPQLARVPLDAGLCFRGQRLFGAHKTLRGAVVMVSATALWAALLDVGADALGALAPSSTVPALNRVPPVAWGALLGLGYILGELPNSFLKRQLKVPPGAAAPGLQRRVFWIADQLDSLGGVALVGVPLGGLPAPVLGWLIAITLLLHPSVAWLMVQLGLKDRIG